MDAEVAHVPVGDASIATARWGEGPPDIVFLHDGLGSVAQWRSIPERVAEATGASVLAYDRPGHGSSTPIPRNAWPADWLTTEAERLDQLLQTVGADRPLLVGHSDGGSISLIHAAKHGNARGLLLLAAHSWVESKTVDAIAAIRRSPAIAIAGLARHHDHAEALFEAWSGVWVGAEFGRWDIRGELGAIDVPVHVVQGALDEYANPDHATETAAAVGSNAECTLLPGLGHLMHHTDADTVVRLVIDAWASTS
jgi:pimeloyl-ACP methyl ester carboxylesterase